MLFKFIFLLAVISAKITYINQSLLLSEIETDFPIKVPFFCFILGYPCATDSKLAGRRFTLYKPLRKMVEYEFDIERGIVLQELETSLESRDSIAYPDFSTQALGIGLGAILLTCLYKLFG